ncbi:MAG TPA: LuxR C-terminal-related transcriptional regulator [Jiangellaceae bacterium]
MATADELVTRGREACSQQAWMDAYQALTGADELAPLDAPDLDRLALAAYLTGRIESAIEFWERAHEAYVGSRDVPGAVRDAFWIGFVLAMRGEHARGGGWLGRAKHMLDDSGLDCVEKGYLQLPAALQALGNEPAAALEICADVIAIAERFGDRTLEAFGVLGSAQARIAAGEAVAGLAGLDEAMVVATTGDVSPLVTGIVYCAVIIECRRVFDWSRAHEWTAVLSRWCSSHQDLKPYRGQCLVHRSELMQLRGEWADAMDEVLRACEHLADPPGDPVMGMAQYQMGELLRLRGEFTRAEKAYREATNWGHPSQPGLALLRLAQGRPDDATAAIKRAVHEADGSVQRSRLLSAHAEIALAIGDVDTARAATEELGEIADRFDSPYLKAVVAYARGCLSLAEGDAEAACVALRQAWLAWQRVDARYECARVRLRMAEACRKLNDHDTAEMELAAAREVFTELGAAPALDQTRELAQDGHSGTAGVLTPRELEVLRLVATGATNRDIADSLVISEKTVARHLSNMLTKLDLPSRTAATAYAYQHDLV